MNKHASICLISSGLHDHHLRLQPWRYLYEVARQLAAQNYRVTIVTDGGHGEISIDAQGIQIVRLPSVRSPLWKRNAQLAQALASVQPDCLLWHIGLTNVIYETLPHQADLPVVGIFTRPIYSRRDLLQLGWRKLGRNLSLCGVQLAGSLISRHLIRARLQQNRLAACVVQTHTTEIALLQQHILAMQIEVIPPGVDEHWLSAGLFNPAESRRALGYTSDDFVVLYMGAPAELRGLPDLIQAAGLARRAQPTLKLLILNRSLADESHLHDLIRQADLQAATQVISGYLDAHLVTDLVHVSDVVALPFELVSSDAPLSLLEVKALGKRLITTSIACLPELAVGSEHILTKPADPAALAGALLVAGARCTTSVTTSSEPRAARHWQSVGEEWARLLQTL